MFAYTLISAEMRSIDGREFEIDLESPRVKNLHVKHYFCLAYFVMLFVQLADEIEVRKQKVESQMMLVQEDMSTKMTQHFSQGSIQQLKSFSEKQSSPNFKNMEDPQRIEITQDRNFRVEHTGNFEMFSSKVKLSVAESGDYKNSVLISSINESH